MICKAGSRLIAVSRRRSSARARLEALVLRHLGPLGLTPALVARSGNVIVQEFIEGDRLPVAMARLPAGGRQALMRRAADALIDAQIAAADAGLSELVPMIGARPGWDADLAMATTRLGQTLALDVPHHEFGSALSLAQGTTRQFVKWDARPGNAIVTPNGSVCWIDWEHAGARRPVDDLVWFFADEWAPDAAQALGHALERLAESSRTDPAALRRQFIAMAVAHSCMRLLLILNRKAGGSWWNHAECLKYDRIGVTPAHVHHLARRAAGWSAEEESLGSLSGFFEEIARRALRERP